MSGSEEYVVVSRRSPVPILLVILVIMNAISVFVSVSYMSRVSQLEREIEGLRSEIKILRVTTAELSDSVKPVSAAMDVYIRFTMARAVASLLNISIYDAIKLIEKGNMSLY